MTFSKLYINFFYNTKYVFYSITHTPTHKYQKQQHRFSMSLPLKTDGSFNISSYTLYAGYTYTMYTLTLTHFIIATASRDDFVLFSHKI